MNHNLKELESDLRPTEKCIRLGAKMLSDAELIACILRTGTGEENVLKLSEHLVFSFGGSAGGLLTATFSELQSVPGIGKAKAVMLLAVGELSKRMQAFSRKRDLSFQSPQSVADYYRPLMAHETQESLRVLYLDGRLGLISEEEISKGTVNSSIVPTREILVHALKNDAVHLMLLHNHPSGDPRISEEDRISTAAVKHAAEIAGIQLVDHIIIGTSGYRSFREEGLIHVS